MSGLNKAITAAGSQQALASAIGLGQSAIANWRKRGGVVPVEYCTDIELAFAGAVTRKDLRPDDWQRHWPELATETVSPPPLNELPEHVIAEAIKANLIKDRRVFVRRAEDRKRLGLDIGAGQGV